MRRSGSTGTTATATGTGTAAAAAGAGGAGGSSAGAGTLSRSQSWLDRDDRIWRQQQQARQQVAGLELQVADAAGLEHLFDLGSRPPFRGDVIACIDCQNGSVGQSGAG